MTSRLTLKQLLGLALFTGSSLFLEIALTRLLSTLFFPPYVFAVLSVAILGIGLGAAAAYDARLRNINRLPLYMSLTGLVTLLLAGITIFAATSDFQIVLFIVMALPYFFVGLTVSTLFSHFPQSSNRLYAADLIGAGLGALLVIPALNAFGVLNGILLIAVVFAASALFFHWQSDSLLPTIIAGITLFAFVSNLNIRWLQVDMTQLAVDKPIKNSLANGGETLLTRWDSFARTDVVQPANGGPVQVYVDGAAGSVMPPAVGADILFQDIGFFPFATGQPQRALVIGPGAGLDVWFGLQSRAQEIVGIEVNPASVAVVQAMQPYNGNLYDHPEVNIFIDEGRSFLRRDKREYDLIFLSQVLTLSAERDGYALVENTVYTVEAFQDYLNHLSDDGQIALKLYDEPTLTRALSLALSAFRLRGLSDAEALRHVAAFLDPSDNIPLLLVNNQSLTEEDALVLGAIAREAGFAPLFLPGVLAQPPLDAVEAGTMPFSEVVANSAVDLSAPTDNRPFFFQFDRGVPQDLQPLLSSVLAITLLGAIAVFALPYRTEHAAHFRWMLLYFAGLGMGFIAAEIAIIQQTRLFLGHPTLAITTVLFVLLIGGGFGSLLSQRLVTSLEDRALIYILAALLALLIIWMLAWPVLSNLFLSATPALRVATAGISLLPLALLMGMPFPIGLRQWGANAQSIALAWGINSVMTVTASVLSVALSVTSGFRAVLLFALLSYFLSWIISIMQSIRRSAG